MRRPYTWILIGLVLVSGSLLVISTFRSGRDVNPVTGKVQQLSLEPIDEETLGAFISSRFISEFHGYSADSSLTRIVRSAGTQLSRCELLHRSETVFQFELLSDSIRASFFPCPGGAILLSKGLIKLLSTEDHVAAVIAHGMGHIAARQEAAFLENKLKSTGISAEEWLQRVLDGSLYGSDSLLLDSICMRRHSVDEELEADKIAIQLMAQSGYDEAALREVLRLFRERMTDPELLQLIQAHPLYQERQDLLDR